MPNHVSTNLVISGSAKSVERFIRLVDSGDDKHFDFNGVVPMPEELKNTTSPVRIQTQAEIDSLWAEYNRLKAAGELKEWQIQDGKPWGLGITQEKSDELIAKYGSNNWYDWAIANWGTKWGAYDTTEWEVTKLSDNVAEARISYHTAWSPASEFFIAASEKFSNLLFSTEYADEGGGFVCETFYENGTISHDANYDWESDDGVRVRTNVGYYDPSEEEDDSIVVAE